MKQLIFLLLLSLTLFGCSQPDPNPEIKDPVYQELQTQLGSASSMLEAEKKKLEGLQKDLSEAPPQTGEIKLLQRKVFESQGLISKYDQEKRYLTLKIEQRKEADRKSYKIAFEKKETWPNPDEIRSFKAELKLRKAKLTWDVNERMKEAGVLPSSSKDGKEGGKGKAEGSPEGEKK